MCALFGKCDTAQCKSLSSLSNLSAAMAPLTKKAAPKGKKKHLAFTVDCSKPVGDRIMDIAAFETFLSEKIKVGGKAGAHQHCMKRHHFHTIGPFFICFWCR
jgi:hypothetical protein